MKYRFHWTWAVLALTMLFVTCVRVRLLNVPLERDEGEYAYSAQLMLDGVAPYKLAYVIKLPGPAFAYACAMLVFGQTVAGVHSALLLANLATIAFLFLLTRRCFNPTAAAFAAATYGLMSLSWAVVGSAAHATQFMMMAVVAGCLFLERNWRTPSIFSAVGAGLCFGMTFLFKQPGLLFGGCAAACLIPAARTHRNYKNLGGFVSGWALPFVLLCLVCAWCGTFNRFWEWTFQIAGGGWYDIPNAWRMLESYERWVVRSHQWRFWIMGAVCLPFAIRAAKPLNWPFVGFCLTAAAAVSLNFRFIPHYFSMALPVLAVGIGLGLSYLFQILSNRPPAYRWSLAVVFAMVCALSFIEERDYLFFSSPELISKDVYGVNPFVESREISRHIESRTVSTDTITVLGSEPEIYFYTHRHSATGHVSTYILMEKRAYSHAMQIQMAREIEAARPKYIIYVNIKSSWSMPPDPDKTLLDEMERYAKDNYILDGLVTTDTATQESVYFWDGDALKHASDPAKIYIYRRKE